MHILITGANGGVASALGQEFSQRGHQLISISRAQQPDWSKNHLQTDCSSAESVATIQSWLKGQHTELNMVIQCAGILHQGKQQPEKSLSRMSTDWLMQSMQTNLLSHVHLAQAIDSLVTRQAPINWVSLSALVGSISENQLGGWHSYRMTKAALNMFVRNLSIEWSRRSPESIAIALHPGTTDTELSKPFQKSIAADKLYTRALTGERLANVLENLSVEQNGKLLHWDGQPVAF